MEEEKKNELAKIVFESHAFLLDLPNPEKLLNIPIYYFRLCFEYDIRAGITKSLNLGLV